MSTNSNEFREKNIFFMKCLLSRICFLECVYQSIKLHDCVIQWTKCHCRPNGKWMSLTKEKRVLYDIVFNVIIKGSVHLHMLSISIYLNLLIAKQFPLKLFWKSFIRTGLLGERIKESCLRFLLWNISIFKNFSSEMKWSNVILVYISAIHFHDLIWTWKILKNAMDCLRQTE